MNSIDWVLVEAEAPDAEIRQDAMVSRNQWRSKTEVPHVKTSESSRLLLFQKRVSGKISPEGVPAVYATSASLTPQLCSHGLFTSQLWPMCYTPSGRSLSLTVRVR